MDEDLAGEDVFLRAGTKLEPLVYGWPAWPHLIAPMTRAANLAFRYLPIMHSFLQNTGMHAASARDPALRGGPFIHLPEHAVKDVAALVETILSGATQDLERIKGLKHLDRHLQNVAHGFSLDAHYAEASPALRGLIELSYDLNDQPRIRLIEALLYEAEGASGSSTVLLSQIADEERPFFMAAPRFAGPGEYLLNLELTDERIDALARMRTVPRAAAEIAPLLGHAALNFSQWFTREPPLRRAPEWFRSEVRVRYLGHACVLVQGGGESILIDPFVAWDRSDQDNRFTFEDLPDRIDYAVITHGHQDHFCIELLMQIRSRIGTVVVPRNNPGELADPSLELILRRLGFSAIRALERFETLETRQGCITSLPFPGEHADLDIHARQSVLVECCHRKLLFLADSRAVEPELYKRLAPLIGAVQSVFIGMECVGAPLSWLYGPLLGNTVNRRNDHSRRLSASASESAWRLLQHLQWESVYVYAMGQEPWMQHVMGLRYEEDSVQLREVQAFLTLCRESGKRAENLYLSREFIL